MKHGKLIGGIAGGALICGAIAAAVAKYKEIEEYAYESIINDFAEAFSDEGDDEVDLEALENARSVKKFCSILSEASWDSKKKNYGRILDLIRFNSDALFRKYHLSREDYSDIIECLVGMHHIYDDPVPNNFMSGYNPKYAGVDPFAEYENDTRGNIHWGGDNEDD